MKDSIFDLIKPCITKKSTTKCFYHWHGWKGSDRIKEKKDCELEVQLSYVNEWLSMNADRVELTLTKGNERLFLEMDLL